MPRQTFYLTDSRDEWAGPYDPNDFYEVHALDGDDIVIGSPSDFDQLFGDAGDDSLYGSDGYWDSLWGGTGADYLDGGDGDSDAAIYLTSTAGVRVDLGKKTASGGDAEGDTLVSIERLQGSKHNDVLVGDSGTNRINGEEGPDILYGGLGGDSLSGGIDDDRLHGDVAVGDPNGGVDTLEGDSGNDYLEGGSGADTIIGGADIDVASYWASAAGVSIILTDSNAEAGGEAAGDKLSGVENIDATRFGDFVLADDNANVLRGFAGDDVINGMGGSDTLEGWEGEDTLIGSSGVDVLLGGADGDDLYGNSEDDVLAGDGGCDALRGQAGNDRFDFNLKSDSVVGANCDVIVGFDNPGAVVGDKIDLLNVDAKDATTSVNETFVWRGTAGFTGAGQVRVYNSGSDTIVAGSTDSDTAAEFEIKIEDGTFTASNYTAADFAL